MEYFFIKNKIPALTTVFPTLDHFWIQAQPWNSNWGHTNVYMCACDSSVTSSPFSRRSRKPRVPPRTCRSPRGTHAGCCPASSPPGKSWPCAAAAVPSAPRPLPGKLGTKGKGCQTQTFVRENYAWIKARGEKEKRAEIEASRIMERRWGGQTIESDSCMCTSSRKQQKSWDENWTAGYWEECLVPTFLNKNKSSFDLVTHPWTG